MRVGEILFEVFVIGAAAAWLVISLRWALRLRQAPGRDPQAYLAHHRAVGSTVTFVAVLLTILSGFAGTWQVALGWIAPTVAIAVVVLGERHWPVPTGRLRTVEIGPPPPRPQPAFLVATVGAIVALTAAAITAGESVSRTAGTDRTAGILVLAGLVVLAATAAMAVRTVRHRPSLPGLSASADRLMRRAALTRVVRLVALGGLLTLIALNGRASETGFVGGFLGPSGRSWVDGTAWVLVVLMIIGGTRVRREDLDAGTGKAPGAMWSPTGTGGRG